MLQAEAAAKVAAAAGSSVDVALLELGHQQCQDIAVFRPVGCLLGAHDVGQVRAAHLDRLAVEGGNARNCTSLLTPRVGAAIACTKRVLE